MIRWLLLLTLPFQLSIAGWSQTSNGSATFGSLEGRVTDATTGNGISGATLQLFPRRATRTGQQAPSTSSSADGGFRFDSVLPGTYVLFANHPDYPSPGGPQTFTIGNGQQVNDVTIRLNPLMSVSGKVFDGEGKPAEEANVQLFSVYYSRGKMQLHRAQNATANAAGEYTIKRVPAGRYYIAANLDDDDDESRGGAETLRTVRTFYPQAPNVEGASEIEVSPDHTVTGADIHLQRARTFLIRGKIETLLPGALQKGAELTLAPRDSPPASGLGTNSQARADGSFEFSGVQSGSYTLWLMGSYAPGIEGNRRGLRRRTLARQDVDVNGTNILRIVLSLMPPVNLTGEIVFHNPPAGANLTQARIMLRPAGQLAFGSSQVAAVAADNTFSFLNVDPGEYVVRVSNTPLGSYVQSLTFNRQDVLTSGIDLSGGGSGEIQVVLRTGAAEVDGTVSSPGSGQGISGTAVLVPEQLAADGSGLLLGAIQSGGTFAIPNVPPGRYYAFAIAQWSSIWQNADFLRELKRQTTAVDVGENGHAEVQISFSTIDQLQPIASQLGLTVQ